MKLWLKLAVRNTRRNLRRTLLTAATVTFGTAMVVVGLAWITGIFASAVDIGIAETGHIHIQNPNFRKRQALHPLYENIPNLTTTLAAIEKIPGVMGAEARITTGAVVTADEEIGDDFALIVGASDRYYRERLAAEDHLLAGRWLTGSEKEVVIGRRLAEQLAAKLGDEVLLLGQTQYGSMSPITAEVVGVVGGDTSLNLRAFLPLSEVQWLTDIPNGALEILVWTESREADRIEPVLARLLEEPALADLHAEAWYRIEPWNAMLGMVDGIKGAIEFLIVFITALAIFNTMTMSVLERSTEIGVMRAMGLTRLGALFLFVLEAATIGLIGGVFGALLGSAPALYLEVHGISLGQDLVDKMGDAFPLKATFYADLTPDILVQAILLGGLIAVLGATVPALRAASIQPVVAMRARR